MSIREISKHTCVAHNTVKKYLRSEDTGFAYAKRVSPSKLDPYAEKLATWLGIEAKKCGNSGAISSGSTHTKCVGQELMERLGQASAQFHSSGRE